MGTEKTPIGEHRYGVGMLVMYKGEKVMTILREYETIEDLGKGYILLANEPEREKTNGNLYMLKFNKSGLMRILEDLGHELNDKSIMARLIARHSRN